MGNFAGALVSSGGLGGTSSFGQFDGADLVAALGNNDDNNNDHEEIEEEEEEGAPPLIQPMSTSASQRLVAGQAVTDLSSAVKELVDNAIDAGAGRVTVKLYDQGLESIEVSDNGSGVPPSSRPLMAMKHATSKLRNFDDLYSQNARDDGHIDDEDNHGDQNGSCSSYTANNDLDCAPTLGFRGEALFCLANLSRSLLVTTRTPEDQMGEQFAFNTQGELMEKSIQRLPRQVGTTVTVQGLFESLPVRRVDMCKRIKGQRMKLIKMMQGYAILCLSTQFNLTDVNSSKSKSKNKSQAKTKSDVRIATSESSKTLEARTASVLGTKFLGGLTRVDVDLSKAVLASSSGETTSISLSNDNNDTNNNATENRWKMTGLISYAPTSPHPANARDLQFFSINGRPVDLPSVSRALGDVWRLFDPTAETKGSGSSSSSGRRRPACILAFTLPNNMYDVNLSPDKREVMFTEESAMSELIREGLMALWTGQSEGTFASNEVESRSNNAKKSRRVATTNSDVKDVDEIEVTELNANANNAKSSSDGNEQKGTSAEAKGDGEIENVAPKLGRRNNTASAAKGADDCSVVTPHNSGNKRAKNGSRSLLNDVSRIHDNISGNGRVSSPLAREKTTEMQENTAVPQQEEEVVTAPPTHQHRDSDRQQSSREWDQLQLPERAREQDRKGWEQMTLDFQRIEKKQLQHDLGCMLPSDQDFEEDRGRSNIRPLELTNQSSRELSTANCERANTNKPSADTRSSSRRKPKRQKQDVASFLDSFAYGATKPAATAQDSDSESSSDNEESETVEEIEVVDNSRRSSRKENDTSHSNKRNARMVVGRALMAEKRPRASLRKTSGDGSHPSSSRARSAPSQLSQEDEDGKCSDAEPEASNGTSTPPVQAVWNSFSGTQHVIAQSQHARLMMQRNRKYLRSSVKRKREKNDRDQDVSAAEHLSSNNATTSKEDEAIEKLCKEDFLHMSIIGQFNLGFILARCRNHSLWILDQHACDEKYNFERLLKETVIHEQKLIAPLPLELSPSEEHCVLEHMDVFERNGFRFSYEPEKEHRHRLSLTALPHSGSGGDGKKAVQFGKEDVYALCAMLGADGTSSSEGYTAGFDTGVGGSRIAGVNAVRRYAGLSQGDAKADGVVGSSIVRLPKAIGMFANRACRGSIMIGTALSHKEQVNILKKLDQTDIPWNCAHGRPTMSHVRCLPKCLTEDDDAVADHVAGPTLSVVD